MTDVIERAQAVLEHSDTRIGHALVRDLIAELRQWRDLAEATIGEQTPDALERWIALSGLSINLHGGYGEWGCETLECLFAELGIQPGDDFETAVEHVRGAQVS